MQQNRDTEEKTTQHITIIKSDARFEDIFPIDGRSDPSQTPVFSSSFLHSGRENESRALRSAFYLSQRTQEKNPNMTTDDL
ncbi:hypothetical protein TNCV_4199521 [Trichonephila clavipes]|uniref:Uncharacterized protein n=1 Tax=Trichonephila clavipes TaxID=2585209 RepID=A0A8X6WCC0_TRICX|nr:hypothetical protein TNCV_4199521 [Trichonephila clavipes]